MPFENADLLNSTPHRSYAQVAATPSSPKAASHDVEPGTLESNHDVVKSSPAARYALFNFYLLLTLVVVSLRYQTRPTEPMMKYMSESLLKCGSRSSFYHVLL